MSAFKHLRDIEPTVIWNDVLSRAVHGAALTLAIVELPPGSAVPAHDHANEQLGIVLRGSLDFEIGAERQVLTQGDIYIIPANTPHRVVAGSDGAVVIDVFAPPREDWRSMRRLPPRPPLWP
jgi:quercetin dioxygenase-like cupin family protein